MSALLTRAQSIYKSNLTEEKRNNRQLADLYVARSAVNEVNFGDNYALRLINAEIDRLEKYGAHLDKRLSENLSNLSTGEALQIEADIDNEIT